MKKRITILMTTLLLTISVCVGCGAESTTTEPTEIVTETTTEESTPAQTEEATAIPEETAEPTPEEKEEPSAETTAETEPETTETKEPEPTEEPTPEPQAIYTYTDMSATMYAQQTVNVRDLPDTNGNKVGSLSINDEITVSGQCNETGWYRFEYNGNVAYVSNIYVSENKVEIQQAPTDNGGDGSSGIQAQASNYQAGVWNDMGDYFFYIANTSDEYWGKFNNCDDIRAILQERYPDRNTYVCGTGNERYCIVSALHKNEKGFPNWSEINYIPELGMN